MNFLKKIVSICLMMTMIFSLIPQNVSAEEISGSVLKYQVAQEFSKETSETVISLKFSDAEIQLDKIILPDGSEQTEDLEDISYAVAEDGTYEFTVCYTADGICHEEKIPVEVLSTEEAEETAEETSAEQNDVQSDENTEENSSEVTKTMKETEKPAEFKTEGNVYTVSSDDEFKDAITSIKESADTEATIILDGDMTGDFGFAGVSGKTITVKSTEGQKYAIVLASKLEGNITLDNVKATAGSLFCNGHQTIFTENSEFLISGTLYGGGYEKTVASTYVKINGTGSIDTSDLENVVVGGSYKGSVEGDTYMELAGNIDFGSSNGGYYITGANMGTSYGGDSYKGDPLYVGGDVNLIIDVPLNKIPESVSATVDSHIMGSANVTVKAGYFSGISAQRGNPSTSAIDGNVHIVAGAPEYENTDRIFRIGSNWDIVGAGESINLTDDLFMVGGNVTIDAYENVWGWDKDGSLDYDLPGIVGAMSSRVSGDVTIKANGSHLEDIIGVDTSWNEPCVVEGDVTIDTTDIDLKDLDDTSFIYPVSEGTIEGNATVNMDGGSVAQINCSSGITMGNTTVNITGEPIFIDNYGVWGQEVSEDSAADKSVLNIYQASASIPVVGYFKTVNITDDSAVTLGNEDANALSVVYDVNINGNSALTTNRQAYAKGALTMDNGSWTGNGYVYVGTEVNTSNSEFIFNDYAALGQKYKGDSIHDKTVVTSTNDTYIFNDNNYTDKIFGNTDINGSTWNILVPTVISGSYTGTENRIILPAFAEGENYPNEYIPLEILGEAIGNTDVILADKADSSEEGIPVVGHNYINALRSSEDVFKLSNENAKADDLFFKKVADADTAYKADYDMWQVAKEDKYKIVYEFISGTDEKELPQEILDLLPTDTQKYSEGSMIKALQPDQTSLFLFDGTWYFNGYDAESKSASLDNSDGNGNIKFIGTWEFHEHDNHINNAPIIWAEDHVLTVGDEFDFLEGVTAIDKENGDLTDKIEIIKSDVDTSTPGTYEVVYKVTDEDGSSSTKTIMVTVKDEKGEKPVVSDPDDGQKPSGGKDPDKGSHKTPDNKTPSTDSPQTGDISNIGLWTSLLAVSGCAFAVVLLLRHKKKCKR